MSGWLGTAHLLLSTIIVVWNVVLAGRITRVADAPRAFVTITGFAGLLIVPALVIALATTTIVTGRAIMLVDWLWPAVVVLYALQATYALGRGLVNPVWGVPILLYDLVIAAVVVTRYVSSLGFVVAHPALVLLAANASTLSLATGGASIANPLYLTVPMIAPAFPALRRLTAVFRAGVAVLAISWVAGVAFQSADALEAINKYRAFASERLSERPEGDFAIGIKLFPDIANPPPPPAVAMDLALADTLGADLVSVVVTPDASAAVIDSLARALDQLQRDSTRLIVSIGYRGALLPSLRPQQLDQRARLATIRRVVRRLHPQILIPAEDPYGVGARLLGRLPLGTWQEYFTAAAAVAHGADRRVRIGVSASAFDSRDSALYAWAVGPGSPMDVVGFSFYPDRNGGKSLDAFLRTADRWMRVMPPAREHWVFAAGGYPLTHGEESQAEAIWASLTWATAHPAIRGLIVSEAGDYGLARGLRAPSGRLRPAAFAVLRGMHSLRENVIVTPTP